MMSYTSLQEVFGAKEAFSLRSKRGQPKDLRPVSRDNMMAEAVQESLCGRLWENDLIALFLVDQFYCDNIF